MAPDAAWQTVAIWFPRGVESVVKHGIRFPKRSREDEDVFVVNNVDQLVREVPTRPAVHVRVQPWSHRRSTTGLVIVGFEWRGVQERR